MTLLIYKTLYIFFVVLEMILFVYIFSSWLPLGAKLKELLLTLLAPIFEPIRFLLKFSVFQARGIDVSPIIALIIISYFQQLFYTLSMV
jgi:YGGT family.